jgi:signal transduction histidine kinase
MGYTQLVKNRVLGLLNERQANALDKVLGHAAAQLHMINTIMQATQIDTVAPERQLVDARELLDQMKSEYEQRFDELLIEFVWDYAAEPAPLVTDAGMLKQILEHLVDNAIKFTERGRVTISMRYTRGYRQSEQSEPSKVAEFKISDTGLGISAKDLPRIFDKFYQVDSSGTRHYEGLGLGLYLVGKFIEKLGGKVHVETQPGKGSTFTLVLRSETQL